MVYDKVRSGDPDYDDKQPPEFHAGGAVVSAGDGIIVTPATGPIDASGAHVNLAVDEHDLDNRPSPGNVADKPSEVQQYSAEDTPSFREPDEATKADLEHIAESQASVRAAAEKMGQTDTRVVTDEDEDNTKSTPTPVKSTPAAEKSNPAKATPAKASDSK